MPVSRTEPAEPEVFDCLSAQRRRTVLAVLEESTGGLSESTLADRVADRAAGASRDRVTVSLHHKHLPKLTDAGLIERDVDAGRVTLADHPALSDPAVRRAVESGESADRLAEVFEALADGRRQRTLDVLLNVHHALDPHEVAALVAAREAGGSPRKVSGDAIERVHASLRHVHLPKLDAAGLVEFDRDAGTVESDGDPVLPTSWLSSGFDRDGIDAR